MIIKNKNGITIKELKEYIKDLPEQDEHGEDFEVWVETKKKYIKCCNRNMAFK